MRVKHSRSSSARSTAKPRARKRTTRSKERLHGSIARELGVAIVSGRIEPGETLDNEIQSSEQMSVSRTAYREAVRILAAKGLVASRPKRGTQVRPKSDWQLLDPEVLSWFFEGRPSQEFLVGLFELRAIIEPAAAALAAERRTADDLATMRNALQRMERHGLHTADGQSGDRDFHDAVLAATATAPSWRFRAASAPPCDGRRSSSNASAGYRATRCQITGACSTRLPPADPARRAARCTTSCRWHWRTRGSRRSDAPLRASLNRPASGFIV